MSILSPLLGIFFYLLPAIGILLLFTTLYFLINKFGREETINEIILMIFISVIFVAALKILF